MTIVQLTKDRVADIYQTHLCQDFPPDERKPLDILLKAMDVGKYECYALTENELLDSAPSGSPEYAAAIELEDGTRHTISFVKYASRTYAANVDGGNEWFAVSQDTVNALVNSMTAGDAED